MFNEPEELSQFELFAGNSGFCRGRKHGEDQQQTFNATYSKLAGNYSGNLTWKQQCHSSSEGLGKGNSSFFPHLPNLSPILFVIVSSGPFRCGM